MASTTPVIVISCVFAYLLGSVSTGIIVSKLFHGPDLRTVGSKNIGASNVQRTMGWKCGLITFFGDALKGIVSCLFAQLVSGNNHFIVLLAGLFCVIGHNWPVYYRFKGGKGVAATGGVILYCFPIPGLICIAIAIAVIAAFRYISLGSLVLVASYALIVSLFFSGGNPCIILWTVILFVMCLIRHRANISRLIHGNENKLGQKSGGQKGGQNG